MTIGDKSIEIAADEAQREALFEEFLAAVRQGSASAPG
jgi:hypothetical protein